LAGGDKMMKIFLSTIAVIIFLELAICSEIEIKINEIELAGPITDRNSELSGMTWYEGWLILMPQYPNYPDYEGAGRLFKIHYNKLLEYIVGDVPLPITPEEISINVDWFQKNIPGFEGFEAIAFQENKVFLTIESEPEKIIGYVISGIIDDEISEIILDTLKVVDIAPQADVPNASEESIFLYENKVFTIYEANGVNINPQPVVHVFDLELNPLGTINFPNIEYRITDVTAVNSENEFWAINYFWPGEREFYRPGADKLSEMYGTGETHAKTDVVERLVKYNIIAGIISISQQAPIQLRLDTEARNLEGLVKLDDKGFLICTDKYPRTILGFIPHCFDN
jgi:hypothetical protein